MPTKYKKKPYKRIALALSLCAIIGWALLGTGASLAWFADTSEEVKNVFHMADFELSVEYKDGNDWKSVTGTTKLFDEQAVYEPGFMQVVYLKIENKGDCAFDFKTAVRLAENPTPATNVFGSQFFLHDYLRFGLVYADSSAEMENAVKTRALAAACADTKLSNYDTNTAALEAGGVKYAALVVCMPEEVNNEANYRGSTVPQVELAIIVEASQQGIQ